MKDLNKFVEKIKGLKQVYMAGGIQKAAQPNSWRDIIGAFFEKNNVKAFNPVSDNSAIFNQSVLGYKEDGSPVVLEELQDVDELKEAMLFRQTEINDKKAMKESDLIFFYYDERIGHGTMTEFDWAYDWKKPIIIVRNVSRKNISHWNKWRRYFGLIVEGNIVEFKNLGEVKEFFIKNLGFKDA